MVDIDTPVGRAAVRRAGRSARENIRDEDIRDDEASHDGGDGGPRLQRKRNRTADKLYIDPRTIPRGMSYEWKRESCYGESDRYHIVEMMDNHWKPVPADRHPNLAKDGDSSGHIKLKGLILMERPAYLTKEAQDEDYDIAMAEIDSNIKQAMRTPDGTMTRNHDSVKRSSRIKTDWSPLTDLADE